MTIRPPRARAPLSTFTSPQRPPKSVREAIARAKKPLSRDHDPVVEQNRSFPEATTIVNTAKKGGVRPDEIADIAEVVENGKDASGPRTEMLPELSGDAFYLERSAREVLSTFVTQYAPDVGSARVQAEIFKAIAKGRSLGSQSIEPDEARKIVAGAQKSGGVTASELAMVREVIDQGIDPLDSVTLVIPELSGTDFYLPKESKQILSDFVARFERLAPGDGSQTEAVSEIPGDPGSTPDDGLRPWPPPRSPDVHTVTPTSENGGDPGHNDR